MRIKCWSWSLRRFLSNQAEGYATEAEACNFEVPIQAVKSESVVLFTGDSSKNRDIVEKLFKSELFIKRASDYDSWIQMKWMN